MVLPPLHPFQFDDRWLSILRKGVHSRYVYHYNVADEDPTTGLEPDEETRIERYRKWSIPVTKFFNSQYGLDEPGWRAKCPLGFGQYAMVVLWRRNNPKESTAVKETFPQFWYEDEDLREAVIQQTLSSIECENIIQLKNYIRFPRQKKHRLYLEYAEHGNLGVLINRYQRWGHYLPEPFLWYLFHSMAKALLVMQFGEQPSETVETQETQETQVDRPVVASRPELLKTIKKEVLERECTERDIAFPKKCTKNQLHALLLQHGKDVTAPDVIASDAKEEPPPSAPKDFWSEVVHRDINPDNVFLGRENKQSAWPRYPVLKLGDFGSAIMTYPDEDNNPEDYRELSMRHNDPPEMGEQGRKSKLLAHTNIYQLGVLMYKATTFDDFAPFRGRYRSIVDNFDPGRPPPPYHAALLHVISYCLQNEPGERPTPTELLRVTAQHLAAIRAYRPPAANDFDVRFADYDINELKTGFWRPSDRAPFPGFTDVQFPPEGGVSAAAFEPPKGRRFVPYECANQHFFPDGGRRYLRGAKKGKGKGKKVGKGEEGSGEGGGGGAAAATAAAEADEDPADDPLFAFEDEEEHHYELVPHAYNNLLMGDGFNAAAFEDRISRGSDYDDEDEDGSSD